MKIVHPAVSAVIVVLSVLATPGLSQLRTSSSFERDSVTLTFTASSAMPFRTVTGAPYSGTQTMETVQTLPNGTHLTRGGALDTVTWRDSLGRVRTERPPLGKSQKFTPPVVIEISDPVDGYSIILDTANHVAHRVALKSVAVRPMPATLLQRPPSTNTMPSGVVIENVPLGNRVINGIEATGMRMTMTYPPGSQLGNDQPVANVSESWFSLRLGMTVLSINSSPGMGDTTTSWKDLLLGESSPDLFRIPADYKTVDETGPFSIKLLRQQ